jgi:Domain of unknown function (DUF362)
MKMEKPFLVDSPIGRCETDCTGAPIGVVRMDPERSYAGIGELLQAHINTSDQNAWKEIKAKIDYTFENIDFALTALENESGFGKQILSRLERRQKLLFKPNLVNVHCIDPESHGPGMGRTACTEWPFVAAVMRWFHDKLGIRYHQMALGEAATIIPSAAAQYSMLHPEHRIVTPEALIEGKTGDFFGGWGFYFTRKYLAETLGPHAGEDPMKGYEESVAGTYIPVGEASDKLMVYDLNRIFDDPGKGREIKVPDGVNFGSVTLHKVVVGGDPAIPGDIKANPGCILVNVPKLKVHAMALFTNVIKNLGIGLYPMQYAKAGANQWDYAVPHKPVPGMKGGIPHQVWDAEMDFETALPKKGADGRPIISKTGGLTSTMIDIIKAVSDQDILMLHVVDAIEAINVDHQGMGMGRKEKEGMVFAGMDAVATDLLSARYIFSNVPIKDAVEAGMDDSHGGHFPQIVPVPTVEGSNIVTQMGLDCPLSRDKVLAGAEKWGLGQRKYHVVGRDVVTNSPLVSIQGHLGTVREGKFSDVITAALYFDAFCLPWCLQKTCFGYLQAIDKLTGSSLKKSFLEAFDEDEDGIVTFEEFGKKGQHGILLHLGADAISKAATEELGYLKGRFNMYSMLIKHGNPQMNRNGEDFLMERLYGTVCMTAFYMSMMAESPDFFMPGMTWGNGKWPSFDLARFVSLASTLYGPGYPNNISPSGLYGVALFYADLTQNEGKYAGQFRSMPDPESVSRYISDISIGAVKPLDFTLFVPPGLDNVGGAMVPNTEVTSDPHKVFTVRFAGGAEVWPGERL